MAMGRPLKPLHLSDEERDTLRRWTRRRKSAQQLALRSRIILLCETTPSRDVAWELQVHEDTVCKWRGRFLKRRLEGLVDEPRPGAPRTVSDERVEEIVRLTLESTPKNATHWSTRQMADHVGVSQSSVSRIWRAFNLQPHRVDGFKLSNDPQFIEKVRDIVGLYMNPPHHAVVLCVDEKSQIQALERSQPTLPMRPGLPERATHDYYRNGTTTLFAALDAATGKVIGECYPRHRADEFRRFLNTIDKAVPDDLDVHLILDNYATHKTKSIQRWLAKRPRFHVHFTPTYSSWLNLVERWFGLLTERKIKRGSHRSTRELKTDIKSFIEASNDAPKPFVWTKTANQILDSLARFCEATMTAHQEN